VGMVKSPVAPWPSGSTEMNRAMPALNGWLSVTVTVVLPPFSVIVEGDSIILIFCSSSATANVTLAGLATPLPLNDSPLTVKVLSVPMCTSSLSTAVMVTSPVLVVCPGAMVRVLGLLRVRSPATAGVTGSTDTVRVVASLDGWLKLAVSLELPPFSLMVVEESARVAVGSSSLSAMVNVRLAGSATPLPPDAAAWTVNILSGVSTLLSTAVMVTVPVLVVSPAAMVRIGLLLKVKSSATAGATGSTDTVRVVASPDSLSSVAVTVVAL